MLIKDWMAASGVAFGTSGARGPVTAMTDALCFAYTTGYLQHLRALGTFTPGTSVAIAGDLRPDTPRILRACAAAITAMGGVVIFCGFVPTPALCLYAFSRAIPSLMVTGSHIPADRNGIKFNRPTGEFLKCDEAPMRAQDVTLPQGVFDDDGALRDPAPLPDITDVIPPYIARHVAFFGTSALEGYRLGIYQHSAVGRDVLMQVVSALGGTPVPLARSDTFLPVDTEAVRPEDIAAAPVWARDHALDAILTTDGDSDRPLLADRHGRWLRGDVLGIIAARFLGAVSVATPINSNTALERAHFARDIQRTRIGSPYVVDAMTQAMSRGAVPAVGYEANGGFLLGSDVIRNATLLPALPTRDAVLPMLCALCCAREEGTDLAGLCASLPPRHTVSDRLPDIPTQRSRDLIAALHEDPAAGARSLGLATPCGAVTHTDETDGLRLTFTQGDIVMLRPSGNAPELRVYVESDTPGRAANLLGVIIHNLAQWSDL